jgi:tRNA pseudouridine55 synthase
VNNPRRAADRDGTLSGLLLVDKPPGLTSFGVVRRVKKLLSVRKVGHLGTLDPFATGLLPLALGEATKLVPFLMGQPKTYRATLKLGEETDTQDLTGTVTGRWKRLPEPEAIVVAAARFVGEIEQTPPLYSALHHQGERLYRLARRGEQVEVAPRRVTILALTVETVALPEVTVQVTCSAGTYVRTLAQDLGRALGTGAHLIALRRLAVGPFSVDRALPLADLEEPQGQEEARGRIIPLADCVPEFKAVPVSADEARALRQGQRIVNPDPALTEGDKVRILAQGRLVAVAACHTREGLAWLAPVRVFSGFEA